MRTLTGLANIPFRSAGNQQQGMGIVHPAIYRDYVKSPMARSSGAVTPENRIEKLPAAVEHRSGAVRHFAAGHNLAYSVGDAERKLDYFVGSGAVGRSYLSSIDGFLFQAPVSWYSAASKWGLSPGFEKSPELNLLRAIEPGCLRCHASGLQPIEGSVNGYRTPAFLEGGVSCERSHRPGDTHAARGKGGIVNPSKLDPVRRDSVCAQCHLSGATEISRGPGAAAFRAGEVLADKSVTFVWSSGDGPMPVISHFERMAQSRCRQAARNRFWCGTCHNPHVRVPNKVSYYCAKCLGCHAAADCPRGGEDCTSCHMPRTSCVSVQHAAFTDHSIPRRPRSKVAASTPAAAVLRPFGDVTATNRELALVWADVALRENNRTFGMRAFHLLETEYQRNPDDAEVAAQLAQIFDRMGQEAKACEIYRRVVSVQPDAIASAINLGTCLARQGRVRESMTKHSASIRSLLVLARCLRAWFTDACDPEVSTGASDERRHLTLSETSLCERLSKNSSFHVRHAQTKDLGDCRCHIMVTNGAYPDAAPHSVTRQDKCGIHARVIRQVSMSM